jgi:serine/threonine protein kinase
VGTGYSFSLFNPERQATYFAVSALDQGGFGSVWSAYTEWGQRVAIKVIKRTADFNQDYSSWFTDQWVHLQCWHNQQVVRTFDQFVSQEGHLVIVMELGGGSLHSLLGPGRSWSDKSICAIGAQILYALNDIHARDVIHRDVTLKNIIWFPGGIFKLCDFGISKQQVHPGEYARTFIGHKSYIPPELISEGYTTHQSDIYQLGLVLLALMTGRHPIPENLSVPFTRSMILAGTPRQLAESLIPSRGQTARIVATMLRRRDAFRYKTAADVMADFTEEFKRLENIERLAGRFLLPNQQTMRRPL